MQSKGRREEEQREMEEVRRKRKGLVRVRSFVGDRVLKVESL